MGVPFSGPPHFLSKYSKVWFPVGFPLNQPSKCYPQKSHTPRPLQGNHRVSGPSSQKTMSGTEVNTFARDFASPSFYMRTGVFLAQIDKPMATFQVMSSRTPQKKKKHMWKKENTKTCKQGWPFEPSRKSRDTLEKRLVDFQGYYLVP